MSADIVPPRTYNRVWRVSNAVLLWMALLFPWMRVDFFENINALGMAVIGGFGLTEITLASSVAEFSISVLGFVFFLGILLTVLYATVEWIFGTSDKYWLRFNTRIACIVFGILATMISSGYFYYLAQGNSASHITAYSLTGYWLCWAGLISSLLFEVSQNKWNPAFYN